MYIRQNNWIYENKNNDFIFEGPGGPLRQAQGYNFQGSKTSS